MSANADVSRLFTGRFWREWVVGHRNKHTEVVSKLSIYEHHLKAAFGELRLDEIGAGEVAAFRALLMERRLGEKRINNVDARRAWQRTRLRKTKGLPKQPFGRWRLGDRTLCRRADNTLSRAALQSLSQVSSLSDPSASALIRLDPGCRGKILPRPIETLLRYRDRRCYGHHVTRRAVVSPRVATGKVVDGKIVTRAKFPEGTKLVLQVEEPPPVIELGAEDERAIDRALASVREGKGISLDKFRAILQRL